jgi:predicted secreted Zn-dependent protease
MTGQLAALVFFVLTAAVANAAPSLAERSEDYAITGRTAAELRVQMDRLGPRAEDGTIYDANTRSELSWRYTFQASLDGCRISTADIGLSVVYVMPKWADYNGGPREVRDSWDRYYGRLTIHEQGHRDVGMQVAADLERDLLDMRRRYCDELGRDAEEMARGSLKTLKDRNRAYDDRTRHGADEGAVFP